jgi:hypothetical protein
MTNIEAMKLALEALGKCRYRSLADEIVDPAITALRTAIAEAEKQDGDRVIRSIKQEAETGLVIGDKIGMRDALQKILREADKYLGIEA